jgi:hypothetical protein
VVVFPNFISFDLGEGLGKGRVIEKHLISFRHVFDVELVVSCNGPDVFLGLASAHFLMISLAVFLSCHK